MKYLMLLFSFSMGLFVHANSLFDDANKAFESGEYLTAISLYDSLTSDGYKSANLFYNMGNTYYKLGDLGNSRLYLEKARKLDPFNADINYNIDSIVAPSTIDQLAEPEHKGIKKAFNSVILSKSRNFWSWSALLLITCGGLSLIYYLYAGKIKMKRLSFYTGISCLVLSITCVAFAFSYKSSINLVDKAVVMETSAPIMSEPSDNSQELFVLHEGTTVKIIDSNDDWHRVEANNKQGWVLKNLTALID